jgi:lantibiotic modifying enzyme
MLGLTDTNSILDEVTDYLYDSDYSDLDYIGLYKGKIGAAYFNYYLYKYYQDDKYAFRSIGFMEEVIDEINNPEATIYNNPSLVNGLAGVGSCLNLLQDEDFLSEDLKEQLAVLDLYLKRFYTILLKENNTDFFGGAIGLLYYFSLRYLSDPEQNNQLMDEVFDLINDQFIEDEKGIRLSTRFGYLNQNGVDLSTAHGIVAMYLIFLKLYEAGYKPALMKDIVCKGIEYIIHVQHICKNTSNDHTVFPNFVTEAGSDEQGALAAHHSHRLAWCNGDLSMLWLLVRAGNLFNAPRLLIVAEELKHKVISRKTFEITRIEFSYFCHGTAGVAQTYRKLYQLTHDPVYLQTYEYWIKQCYLQLEKDYLGANPFPYKSTLLFGWAGPLLTLLNYKTDKDYKWDQIFLLS